MIAIELHKLWLSRSVFSHALIFFVFVLCCGSMALGYDIKSLRSSAPFFFWILMILTTLFATPHLLKSEVEAGLVDEILLHPKHSAFFYLSRVVAEGLVFGLPLSLLSFCLAPLYGLSYQEGAMFSLTLILGFPALSALGLLGGLLTVEGGSGGIMVSLLILPLTLPLLLFGLSVMDAVYLGLDSFRQFCLLTGVSLLIAFIATVAGSWALRFVGEG